MIIDAAQVVENKYAAPEAGVARYSVLKSYIFSARNQELLYSTVPRALPLGVGSFGVGC